MARGILAVLSIALTVFALADCVQTQDDKVRGVPKWAWIVLIVLIPWVGPLTWLFVGKERSWWGRGSSGSPGPRRDGPLAPDEDPEFLRKLDEDIRRERRERRERGEGPGDSGELDDGPGDGGTDTGRSA
ncbi:PLD nuclease N-terminal domain-containing protein [Brachybacterium sp. GU-2]|uniref:PLD nuclease N-terminal domain-containing protein n=1 Tax=Brachybacterium sp. GU-2 TaxID=3069708 RepID=UPI00280B03E9|nr:PLD nuclease N-terminal domain-containing protein [Brachybacterium sp. GU-2]WME22034.1 PLD nuclease N-terminal domain-containing protein [Brachybacterium sp. GU-2]